jgi:hypothetical protein
MLGILEGVVWDNDVNIVNRLCVTVLMHYPHEHYVRTGVGNTIEVKNGLM